MGRDAAAKEDKRPPGLVQEGSGQRLFHPQNEPSFFHDLEEVGHIRGDLRRQGVGKGLPDGAHGFLTAGGVGQQMPDPCAEGVQVVDGVVRGADEKSRIIDPPFDDIGAPPITDPIWAAAVLFYRSFWHGVFLPE